MCESLAFGEIGLTPRELHGALGDRLLELLVAMLDLFLGRLERRALENVPHSTPPGDGEVMNPTRIENVARAEPFQGIGAQKDTALLRGVPVKADLEIADLPPVLIPEPGVVARAAEPLVPLC